MKSYSFFIIALLVVGCGNGPRNSKNNENSAAIDSSKLEYYETVVDTLRPEVHIVRNENLRVDSLKKSDIKKYAQTLLKQMAYCGCLYESLKHDSLFRVIDRSYYLLATDLVLHSRDIVDSIQTSIKNYVAWINTIDNDSNAKNLSLLCLDYYESRFLDSLVRKYDNKIIKVEDE